MIKVNVKCLKLNNDGQGVFKFNNKLLAVKNFLPNEEAVVQIEEINKVYKVRNLKIIKSSSKRCENPCAIYNKCGGCQFLHLKYDEALAVKSEYVKEIFKENEIPFALDEVIKADNIYHYRNKMQVSYKRDGKDIIYGFYEEATHKIILLTECVIQTKTQNKIARYIGQLMQQLRLVPYDEDKGTGLIRFIMIKEAFNTNQIMVIIVTSCEMFPGSKEFVKRLRDGFPQIKTIIQNINSRKTSIILGDKEKVLYGTGYINDNLCGIDFQLMSKSFFQINPKQTEKLYTKIIECADTKGDEIAIDAYCGVGTIGIILSKHVKQVIGVESDTSAVRAAINNCKRNDIRNVRFINDDATNFILNLAKDNIKIDLLIMDPPRTGSTEIFLKTLLQLKPKKVIYVSCDVTTLVRDLKILIKDYRIIKTALVDLFAGTKHIEMIISLVHL